MDKQTKYFLDKLQEINVKYLEETEQWLQHVFHLVLHDSITLDDVCEIGERYGLDIEKSYNKLVDQFEDEENKED